MANPYLAFKDGNRIGGNDGEPPNTEMDISQRLIAIETVMPTLATKADLDVGMAEIRADVADIRVDIHKAITENARWTHTATIGMFTAFVLGVLGLLFTIWNATKQSKESGPGPSQPPIIINVPAPAAIPAQVPPSK
ncbi:MULTISPECIES: hypothetical protein [unclassified Caballeronia]|uniref:hypothetical protein n=1 Tax=unclassified Caballeronia TaxID=2646786 RepID=UPI0028646B59|nr:MULTISPECIES: hypothetical protein [unclassified Caballeronia]MDR5776251.1 hypothetical protein [Caballeronia sp. LZ002]MDR5851691.1 hypothetical protein [Caballeronia sp. LZ003]